MSSLSIIRFQNWCRVCTVNGMAASCDSRFLEMITKFTSPGVNHIIRLTMLKCRSSSNKDAGGVYTLVYWKVFKFVSFLVGVCTMTRWKCTPSSPRTRMTTTVNFSTSSGTGIRPSIARSINPDMISTDTSFMTITSALIGLLLYRPNEQDCSADLAAQSPLKMTIHWPIFEHDTMTCWTYFRWRWQLMKDNSESWKVSFCVRCWCCCGNDDSVVVLLCCLGWVISTNTLPQPLSMPANSSGRSETPSCSRMLWCCGVS
jgi:hypothetical protein